MKLGPGIRFCCLLLGILSIAAIVGCGGGNSFQQPAAPAAASTPSAPPPLPQPPPPPTITFAAAPAAISSGSSSTLSWTTTNATSLTIDQGLGAQQNASAGSVNVSPAATTTYTATASGANNQSVSQQVTVTVSAPPPPPPPPPPAPTLAFSATPATITAGGSATLSWTTNNVSSLTIDNGIDAVQNPAAGSIAVNPTITTTYTATAVGTNGQSIAQTAVVTVKAPAPTITFSASPTSINSGSSSTLSWTTSNAASLSIDNGIGLVTDASTGSVTVSPATTTTYTATATSSDNQTVTAKAIVTVVPQSPTASPLQHVIVLIMQNRSFDQLFGMYPGTTGNTVEGIHPGIPGYSQIDSSGKSVSPFLQTNAVSPLLPEGHTPYLKEIDNGLMDKYAFVSGDVAMGYFDSSIPGIPILWGYADQFALADHYFSSVIAEAPTNQLYMVAASDNGSLASVQPSFGPCQQPDPNSQPYNFKNVADELSQNGFTLGVFQESFGVCSNSNPMHNPFQYFTSTHTITQDYTQFAPLLKSGNIPEVSFIIPSGSNDLHPGNDRAISVGVGFIDTLVHDLQTSPAWSTTALIVTFDTAGGWYDHVPPPHLDAQGLGPRVPMLVISPYAKKGYVSHVQMDHVSILKFIQWNWRLNSLNARNALSGDMLDMFQF